MFPEPRAAPLTFPQPVPRYCAPMTELQIQRHKRDAALIERRSAGERRRVVRACVAQIMAQRIDRNDAMG